MTSECPSAARGDAPSITVIALCYNHAKFVVECLESIRNQTCQRFEFIICDDFSKDNSRQLIDDWIREHGVDCRFIRNPTNLGICRTLNNAISQSTGDYICMIATDDRWHPQRIQRHLDLLQHLPPNCALVYSDVQQIDEEGRLLPRTFLQAQLDGGTPPSGRVLPQLLTRNFVHPLAATIRRHAIEVVGAYDERLVVEDYDMWLRLAERFEFHYLPEALASYRIVNTSLTRTLFNTPSAAFAHGKFLLCEKWLPTAHLSIAHRTQWLEDQWAAAYWLYRLQDSRATACLWVNWRRRPRLRTTLLLVASALGITWRRAQRIAGVLKRTD